MTPEEIAEEAEEVISAFCIFITNAVTAYRSAQEAEIKFEDETQDYLHWLELVGMGCVEQSRLTSALKQARQRRRTNKEAAEVLYFIEAWAAENKRAVDKLRNVLGDVRKKNAAFADRAYHFRQVTPGAHIYHGKIIQ